MTGIRSLSARGGGRSRHAGPGGPPERDWRARRWDALVLGSRLPSLVCAIRLGMAGHRVLVVEEAAAARLHPALREPFFLAGGTEGGVLSECLRALTLPLIDRRRIQAQDLAFQVLGPRWRVDLGDPPTSLDEWVAWGLCKPEEAAGWIESWLEAGRALREADRQEPSGRAASWQRVLSGGSGRRGEEPALSEPNWTDRAGLGGVLHAALLALSDLRDPLAAGSDAVARARLLACAVSGGVGFPEPPPWLHGLLRRRAEAVFCDFRTLASPFHLVNADGQAGLALPDSSEIWLGRSLVIGCPTPALARHLEPEERPPFLEPSPGLRRGVLRLRARAAGRPEGLADRAVWVRDPEGTGEGSDHLALDLRRDPEAPAWLDLAVRVRVPWESDPGPLVESAARHLVEAFPSWAGPDTGLAPAPVPWPAWDLDGWIEDLPRPPRPTRVSHRPPVYCLDRGHDPGRGLEGALLAGWRAGDEIGSELP